MMLPAMTSIQNSHEVNGIVAVTNANAVNISISVTFLIIESLVIYLVLTVADVTVVAASNSMNVARI